jgi:hypothetical protein
MKRHTAVLWGLAAVVAATLSSCAASTQLTSSWVDPEAPSRTHNKIVVVGVSTQPSVRRMYEDAFAQALRERGMEAIASYSVVGEGKLDQAAAEAKLKELGADGVIVTRLVDQETVQEYYPPSYTTVAAPSAYYGGWYGYYSLGYTYMSSPGYVAENKVFRLETNFYDVANPKLLWSGLTESTIAQGDAPTNEIMPTVHTLLADMEKKGVIPKAVKK